MNLKSPIHFADVSGYWLDTGHNRNWGMYWNTSTNSLELKASGSTKQIFDIDNNSITTGILNVGSRINSNSLQSYDKLRVWNSADYTIGMKGSQTYGALNSYAMTFTMSNHNDRGFLWRHSGMPASDGAMSLSTDGRLFVRRYINVPDFYGKVHCTGTGNDYNVGGVEVRGNGSSNTVFPTIGFHQPHKFASSIQLRGAGDFRLYTQGTGSYADLTARYFKGTLHGNATSADRLTPSSRSAKVGSGWMTVASNYSGRHSGKIVVSDSDSGNHAYIEIDWLRSYADSNVTVLNVGGHGNRITGVRVLYETSDNTYKHKLLQVYVTKESLYTVNIYHNVAGPGWGNHSIVTPVIENTKSGYAVHKQTITSLENCSLAAQEGIATGGLIRFVGTAHSANDNQGLYWDAHDKEGSNDRSDYAHIRQTVNTGGLSGTVLEIKQANDPNDGVVVSTNSSRGFRHNGSIVWTSGNDGHGSGLDADKLDGKHLGDIVSTRDVLWSGSSTGGNLRLSKNVDNYDFLMIDYDLDIKVSGNSDHSWHQSIFMSKYQIASRETFNEPIDKDHFTIINSNTLNYRRAQNNNAIRRVEGIKL